MTVIPVLKYIPLNGVEQKRVRGNKDFKKGEQSGSKGGCFNKEGNWNLLSTFS